MYVARAVSRLPDQSDHRSLFHVIMRLRIRVSTYIDTRSTSKFKAVAAG